MDNRRRSMRLIRPATILAGRPIRWTPVLVAVGLLAWTTAATAEIQLKTESFANSVAGFTECAERIQSTADRNLLARPNARLVASTETSNTDPKALTDGEPGIMGSDGRVGIEGQPSVVTYYLGEPKTVTELGLFTFNGDARANQDYEVRLANNSGRPGVMPVFGAKADLTTGDVVLGADGGGFHTRFVDSQGGPLVPGKVDWVQLKIWRTYSVRAGEPAKGNNKASSWASVVEIEVLGTPDDVFAVPPEVLAARKVEAARKRLASISPQAAEVLNEAEPLRRAGRPGRDVRGEVSQGAGVSRPLGRPGGPARRDPAQGPPGRRRGGHRVDPGCRAVRAASLREPAGQPVDGFRQAAAGPPRPEEHGSDAELGEQFEPEQDRIRQRRRGAFAGEAGREAHHALPAGRREDRRRRGSELRRRQDALLDARGQPVASLPVEHRRQRSDATDQRRAARRG